MKTAIYIVFSWDYECSKEFTTRESAKSYGNETYGKDNYKIWSVWRYI